MIRALLDAIHEWRIDRAVRQMSDAYDQGRIKRARDHGDRMKRLIQARSHRQIERMARSRRLG